MESIFAFNPSERGGASEQTNITDPELETVLNETTTDNIIESPSRPQ